MPLVNRPITHSRATFMAWLCCLPCTLATALCCMACGQCGKAAKCACAPCLDEKLENMAGSVASSALSTPILGQPHAKLLALKTDQWDSTYLFGFGAIMDNMHSTLYGQIRDSVENVLNVYNFGPIQSEKLTEDELKFIGDQLRDAIFSQLPSKEDFDRDLQSKEIAPNNTAALNGYLAGLVSTIIGGDFIRNQLNRISSDVELKRAGNALVAAQTQASIFKGINAGLHTNLVNDAGQPLQPPPAYASAGNRI